MQHSLSRASIINSIYACTVQSNKTPLEIATDVAKEADEYNGFNLVLADLTTNVMVYVSKRPKGQPATIQLVPPGLHVLSNARLDSPWQKVVKQRSFFLKKYYY
jgi:uncharacterized protein with NRDE domain